MWCFLKTVKSVKFYNLIDRSGLFSTLDYKVSEGSGQDCYLLPQPTIQTQAAKTVVATHMWLSYTWNGASPNWFVL